MGDQGHANNVAHFEELVSICAGLGAPYNPSNGDIELSELQNKHTSASGAFDGWQTAKAGEKIADTNRENGFKVALPVMTASYNYYASTDSPENRVEDVLELMRKLRGQRAKKLVDDPNTPEDESQGGISAAQTSYVQKVAHIEGIIDIYTADGMYSPNEDHIKVVTLQAMSDQLKNFNTDSINANTNTQSNRSSFFVETYTGDNNMIDLAMQVKKYLKALLGPSNIIYKQAAGLKFTRPKA